MNRKAKWAVGLLGYVFVAWLLITVLWDYIDFYAVSVVLGVSIFCVVVWVWFRFIVLARLKGGKDEPEAGGDESDGA